MFSVSSVANSLLLRRHRRDGAGLGNVQRRFCVRVVEHLDAMHLGLGAYASGLSRLAPQFSGQPDATQSGAAVRVISVPVQ